MEKSHDQEAHLDSAPATFLLFDILTFLPQRELQNGLRRTPTFVETCAGLSQTCMARLPDSFHATGDYEPRMAYLYMAAV